MKKIVIILLTVLLITFSTKAIGASDYMSFQEIEFEHSGAMFLEDYSGKKYDKSYDEIKKRQFFGWKQNTVYKTEKVYYVRDTIMKIENEGSTPIIDTITLKSQETIKKQYNVSGSLKLSSSGDVYGTKLSFEEKLDYSITATSTSATLEQFVIKVQVDPNTRFIIQVCGEGNVSNGVAKYFAFWRIVRQGGWEVFVVTTEYYSLTKEYIDESLIITEVLTDEE